jgi:hypothetical protein
VVRAPLPIEMQRMRSVIPGCAQQFLRDAGAHSPPGGFPG